MSEQRPRRWFTLSGAASIIAGIVVFAAFVWNTGPAEVWQGVVNVGWMFPVIIALGGLRFLVRAAAWSLCTEAPHRLDVTHAFTAVLAGDAVGNVTPLGPIVGEPAKAVYVRQQVALQPALTALAIENIFYTLSTAAMIVAGAIALLFAFDLPPVLREFSEAAVVLIVLLFVAAGWILWTRPAIISRLLVMTRPGSALHSNVGRVQALEDEIYTFASRRRGTVFPLILLEVSFHALGVLETHLAMWMILGDQPTFIQSFTLEAAHRLITVVFKIVPFQLGVGEAGASAVTSVLGMGLDPGVILAVVRKARMGVWALIGGALLLRIR